MGTVVRTTVFIDFPVETDSRGVFKLSGEGPEALRQSGTDQSRASTLKDVEVSTLDDEIIFGNASSRRFLHNSKSGTRKLQLGGIIGAESTNSVVAKEVHEGTSGSLTRLAS